MDAIISIAAILVMLLVAGGAIGVSCRGHFSFRWLLVAAGLVLLNDALLTRCYGLMPKLVPAAHLNWQGKLLALTATLVIAALPAFRWQTVGLTWRQRAGSMRSAGLVAVLYALFFVGIALAFDSDRSTLENSIFQLTLPGLEEEPFFRGILLLALDRAFTRRITFLGVEWGWGAMLSCALFGIAHAFSFADGAFSFDLLTFVLTGVPALLLVWLRYRTGSLLLPILLHNFGNSIINLL